MEDRTPLLRQLLEDRILVLDRGRLTEHGTHAELMERQGVYHRLYQIQFGHAAV